MSHWLGNAGIALSAAMSTATAARGSLGSMSEIEICHQLTPTNTECNASASGMLAPATISGLLPSVAERPHSLTVGTVDRL
jgi:hypothetical protein